MRRLKALRRIFIRVVSNPKLVLAGVAALAVLAVALGYGDSSYYKFAGKPVLGDLNRMQGIPGWGDIARIIH